jgi:methylglutaconyl-CoA hydratase
MSAYTTLRLARRRDGLATITMSRPDVFNAFDEVMIEELDLAFAELIADEEARVILLAGEGRHFSAGADLQWMQRASEATQEWNLNDARRLSRMLARIDSCPKPTLARVQGAALGGGVGLACACDLAIAAEEAVFAVSEAKFGILPSTIGPYLVNALGRRQAKRLALTTTRIRAPEALAIGLVQQVVSKEALDAAIDQVVVDLLSAGPNAQREIKALFAQLKPGPITEDIQELTAQTISRVRATDEAKEGFAAFLEKRPARWIRT